MRADDKKRLADLARATEAAGCRLRRALVRGNDQAAQDAAEEIRALAARAPQGRRR